MAHGGSFEEHLWNWIKATDKWDDKIRDSTLLATSVIKVHEGLSKGDGYVYMFYGSGPHGLILRVSGAARRIASVFVLGIP